MWETSVPAFIQFVVSPIDGIALDLLHLRLGIRFVHADEIEDLVGPAAHVDH